ncbi:MAG: hypothetical protein M3P96_06280 [Actinomycetota bacterium]|nr:hypothetical protein [Actinomycetota bacterium]
MSSGGPDRRWGATLVGGVVVLGAVSGLLEALRRSVGQVERRVDGVWAAGQRLASVTQIGHLTTGTRRLTAELRESVDGSTARER